MSLPEGYEAVIGLEIHVQLSTRTKMFCGCELSFGEQPNVHTCPVCLAHPGVLPVVNEQAVRYALQIALALESDVSPRSIFHRKNYFYPDNPKGYQISQYDIPLARGGRLGEVRIHRVHLEEDAAKLTHVGESGRIHGSATSLVDFNRGGTPLVEIVTEPDLRGPAQAREWAQLLRTTVKQLGVSDVNMEEGSLRCDANVSVRRAGAEELGTKTELKNMNSFRFLERGIAAELERQGALLEAGGKVEQETFHFDPRTGSLTPLRSKEYAHDYRYFPEPDLVPLAPTEEMLRAASEALPELPAERRERYEAELGLPEVTARQLAFDAELGAYFERALDASRKGAEGSAADGAEPTVIANWVTGELVGRLREAGDGEVDPANSKVSPEALAALAGMVEAKQVTTGAARQVLATLVAEGGDPAEIVEREGLAQMSDAGELEGIVERAIEAEPGAAEKVRAGNPKAIGPIVGAVMRETKGRADGGEVTRLIREKLGLR
jgi:aspartyl-tRNA(Asn)/glutamyl-tRNA(Gln) amidotransferase subunit B